MDGAYEYLERGCIFEFYLCKLGYGVLYYRFGLALSVSCAKPGSFMSNYCMIRCESGCIEERDCT
jgi:hypothetical protein